MPTLSAYCKAYLESQLVSYSSWNAKQVPTESPAEDVEAVVFVHDDYVVTRGIYRDDGIVFDDVTEEWKAFCKEQLGFSIP
jgi:hypothetical protein